MNGQFNLSDIEKIWDLYRAEREEHLAEIANLRRALTDRQWISVNDRLPRDGLSKVCFPVMVEIEEENEETLKSSYRRELRAVVFSFTKGRWLGLKSNERVTHWFNHYPLPEREKSPAQLLGMIP